MRTEAKREAKSMGDKAKHGQGLGKWLSWLALNQSLDLQTPPKTMHSRPSLSPACIHLQHTHVPTPTHRIVTEKLVHYNVERVIKRECVKSRRNYKPTR